MKLVITLLALGLGGCHVDWRKLGVDEAACLAPGVRGAVESAADTLVSAADEAIEQGHGPTSQEWTGALTSVATSFGVGALLCAGEHLLGDLFDQETAAASGSTPPLQCNMVHVHKVTISHLPYLKRIRR